MHTCVPKPKAICRLALPRVTSNSIGCSNMFSSWLEEKYFNSTMLPAGISTPPIVWSFLVMRHMFDVGDARRRVSSTRLGIREGSLRTAASCSGLRHSWRIPSARVAVVVSLPATRNWVQWPSCSSIVIGRPSTSAWAMRLRRSSRGLARLSSSAVTNQSYSSFTAAWAASSACLSATSDSTFTLATVHLKVRSIMSSGIPRTCMITDRGSGREKRSIKQNSSPEGRSATMRSARSLVQSL